MFFGLTRLLYAFLATILASISTKYVSTKVNEETVKNHKYTITVNARMNISTLQHFWKSTGFCPPDPHQDFYKYMSTNDMAQNIIYIGSVPNQGIEQIRIHFLLDLVSMHFDNEGTIVLNLTFLDQALDFLVKNNWLKPGFELMGNPSGYFTDFDDTKQIYDWMEMIRALGLHLIGQ